MLSRNKTCYKTCYQGNKADHISVMLKSKGPSMEPYGTP